MSSPTADVSVRIAWADDAPAIAELQVRTWPELYADLVPADALPDDVAAAAAAWRDSLSKPRDARNRVLVALERNRVVGFAITSPASDPDCDPIVDAELAEVTIDPAERGKGHGSRLLQAAADTLVADRFQRAVLWSMAGDDALRKFLTEAGWAADGAHRELDLDGIRQHPRQAGQVAHRAHRLDTLISLGTTVTMEIHSTSGGSRVRTVAAAPPHPRGRHRARGRRPVRSLAGPAHRGPFPGRRRHRLGPPRGPAAQLRPAPRLPPPAGGPGTPALISGE